MEFDDKIERIREENETKDLHYYGDTVRSLYLAIAVVMLVMTPLLKQEIAVPAFFAIVGVLLLSLIAGLTNPRSRLIIVLDVLTSIVVFLVFGYEVTISYEGRFTDLFFFTNLVVAALSLFAIYFSTKTFRGRFSSQSN